MSTAAQAYAMLGNQTLWDTARHCHEALRQAGVAYAVVGGVAVCLHGYQRNTVRLAYRSNS
jgi:precorrin-2 methylase